MAAAVTIASEPWIWFEREVFARRSFSLSSDLQFPS